MRLKEMGKAYEQSFETEVLMGEQLKQLPEKRKLGLGQQVSELIAEHKATMLQYTAQQVEEIMNESRAVVVINSSRNSMCAFAQLSPWCDSSGKVMATEFRSWISNRHGGGLPALRGAVKLNQEKYPGVSMYSVIEENNRRAQRIVMQAGAEEVPMPNSIKVILKAGDQPAPVRTYDLTKIKPY